MEKDQNTNQDATAEEILNFLQDKTTESNSVNKEEKVEETEKLDIEQLKTLKSEVIINNKSSNETNNSDNKDEVQLKPSDVIDSKDPTMHFDKMFINLSNSNDLNPFVLDLSKVTITDDEKEDYLRAVLLSERFISSIDIKRHYKIKFQSKLLEEQKFIANRIEAYAIEPNPNDKNQLLHSPVDVYVYALKLNVILADPSINDEPVFTKDLNLEQKLKLIETFPVAKWNLLVNAARIFEKKENLLSKFILDEDF